jgi:hypothetical protein
MLMVSIHASAASAKEAVATGLGSYTCSQYAQMYRNDPQHTDIAFGSWAQGFMSGLNWSLMDQKMYRNLGEETADDAFFAFRQYCDAHPLATFVQAVLDHYSKLPLKRMPHSN